jgi:hypothetical protein
LALALEDLEGRRMLAAPKVQFAQFDGPTPTYTPKSHVLVRFTDNVAATFGPGDVELTNLDDGSVITNESPFGDNFAVSYNAATNTGVITFPGLIGEQLADGNYQLRLIAPGIKNAAGEALDGNGDGTGGDDYTFVFYRLTGDTQVDFAGGERADRTVDFADYQVMAKNIGRTNATPRDGDFNYDGVVDSVDFDILFGVPFDPLYPGTFGNKLPPPPPAPAAPVVVSAPAATPAPVVVATPAKPVKQAAAPAPAIKAKPAAKPAPVVSTPSRFAAKRIKGASDWLASA